MVDKRGCMVNQPQMRGRNCKKRKTSARECVSRLSMALNHNDDTLHPLVKTGA